jgi:Transposase, Mutator family
LPRSTSGSRPRASFWLISSTTGLPTGGTFGLWEGSTETATVARALFADLADRGLDSCQAILFVIDGAKALRTAIGEVFGSHAVVDRRDRHKERNVTDLVAEAHLRKAAGTSSSRARARTRRPGAPTPRHERVTGPAGRIPTLAFPFGHL